MPSRSTWSFNPTFAGLFPDYGQIAHLLRTRAPVAARSIATSALPLDLHVLGLSLAFILSQDQTLRCKFYILDWPSLAESTCLFECPNLWQFCFSGNLTVKLIALALPKYVLAKFFVNF